jgi:PTS system nitrogen regulatory IIA component
MRWRSCAPPSIDEVQRVLAEREAVASTGVGDGVAIPHGRLPGLTKFVGALAIRREGVAFDAVDGRPASIFFGLIGPDRAAGEHLKCLARISRVLRDDAVRTRLLHAEEPEKALAIVLEVDGG